MKPFSSLLISQRQLLYSLRWVPVFPILSFKTYFLPSPLLGPHGSGEQVTRKQLDESKAPHSDDTDTKIIGAWQKFAGFGRSFGIELLQRNIYFSGIGVFLSNVLICFSQSYDRQNQNFAILFKKCLEVIYCLFLMIVQPGRMQSSNPLLLVKTLDRGKISLL